MISLRGREQTQDGDPSSAVVIGTLLPSLSWTLRCSPVFSLATTASKTGSDPGHGVGYLLALWFATGVGAVAFLTGGGTNCPLEESRSNCLAESLGLPTGTVGLKAGLLSAFLVSLDWAEILLGTGAGGSTSSSLNMNLSLLFNFFRNMFPNRNFRTN